MKPVVTYHRRYGEPVIGQSVTIAGLTGHPRQASGRLDGDYVRTSAVVRVGVDGEFETLNTIYRPEEARK